MLMFFGFLIFLGLLVAEFSIIDQTAHGRSRRGSDFHQVNSVRTSHADGLGEWKYSHLLKVNPNYADFAGTDFPVDPDERSGRSVTAGKERATQDTLFG